MSVFWIYGDADLLRGGVVLYLALGQVLPAALIGSRPPTRWLQEGVIGPCAERVGSQSLREVFWAERVAD